MRRRALITWLAGLILLGFSIWWWTKPTAKNNARNTQPLAVTTVHARIQAMPFLIQTVGAVEAEKSVLVIPQVSGVIRAINFTEGQNVQAGQLLMTIDPTAQQLNLQQAEANLARDKAQLQLAEANAKRYGALVKLEYVTRQQYEEAVATAAAQRAVVAADQDQVQQAQLQLDYTQVRAPISGKTGSLTVKVGDLVTANGTNPLVTINQLGSVLINFSIPQTQLSALLRYQRQGTLSVLTRAGHNQSYIPGQLVFIDNTVNPQTGTVTLKAKIDNNNQLLWPGQAVTVRLILAMQPNAIVIPSTALQIDQNGYFVYIVLDGKAKIQRLTVDRQIDQYAVISAGLKGQETILTQIPPNLKEGSPVSVQP